MMTMMLVVIMMPHHDAGSDHDDHDAGSDHDDHGDIDRHASEGGGGIDINHARVFHGLPP